MPLFQGRNGLRQPMNGTPAETKQNQDATVSRATAAGGTTLTAAGPRPSAEGSATGTAQLGAAEIGSVLPDAITASIKHDRGSRLARALTPTIEQTIKTAVRRDPKVFSDALFPVMGPAIRKAINEAFRAMIQQINQTLDYSFSRDGLRWRIEAARTGKSYAEVVLYHTLVYRVEQVFLIHRETGLLLQHVTAGLAEVPKADMVSGMLTAIQDFVRDSFNAPAQAHVQTLEVGDLTVWVEQGPEATLAVAIRGNPPNDTRVALQKALETIHAEFSGPLTVFDGDTTPFDDCRPILEGCLLSHLRRPKKSMPAIIAVAVIVALGLGALLYRHISERLRWEAYFDALKAQPGVVISQISRHGGRYRLEGLRDPLAAAPEDLLQEAGLDPNQVSHRWKPYQSLEPALVLLRAKHVLRPPDTVTLGFDGATLTARGAAPRAWIRDAAALARALPGVASFASQAVVDLDRPQYEVLVWETKKQAFQETKARIEDQRVAFRPESVALDGNQHETMTAVRDDIAKIVDLARFLEKDLYVCVVGHDSRPQPNSDAPAPARLRAEAVAAGLTGAGVGAAHVKPLVETVGYAAADETAVTFRVVETPRAGATER